MQKKTAIAIETALYALSAMTTLAVFLFSMQSGEESGELSRSFLSMLLDWLPFEIQGGENSHLLIRKLAHFGIFFLDSVFLSLALAMRFQRRMCVQAYKHLFFLIVAAVSEIIQIFAEGRGPAIADVFIDYAGAFAGALAVRVCVELRHRTMKR